MSFFCGILLLLVVPDTKSQGTEAASRSMNGVYVEFYGLRHDFSEGFVSVNYERVFGKKQKANFRVGIYPDFESTVSIPVTITWISRPAAVHHFEYGFGAVARFEHYVNEYEVNPKEWFFDVPALMLPLMYRYQKKDGFYFRAGINVFLSWPTIPSPSLSMGYKF
jgi:hypothetical protein